MGVGASTGVFFRVAPPHVVVVECSDGGISFELRMLAVPARVWHVQVVRLRRRPHVNDVLVGRVVHDGEVGLRAALGFHFQ